MKHTKIMEHISEIKRRNYNIEPLIADPIYDADRLTDLVNEKRRLFDLLWRIEIEVAINSGSKATLWVLGKNIEDKKFILEILESGRWKLTDKIEGINSQIIQEISRIIEHSKKDDTEKGDTE